MSEENYEKAIDPKTIKQVELFAGSQGATLSKEDAEIMARLMEKAPRGEKTEGRSLPPFLPFLVGNGIITCALIVTGIWTYHYNFAPKAPVAIDIRGYVEEQKQFYAEGKINSEQLRQNMDHLEEVVARISSRQAVFMADAVIKNVEIIKP